MGLYVYMYLGCSQIGLLDIKQDHSQDVGANHKFEGAKKTKTMLPEGSAGEAGRGGAPIRRRR